MYLVSRTFCLALFAWLRLLAGGGDDGVRTHDPLLAGQVLSQLSYTPIWGFLIEFPYGHSKLNNKLYALASLVYFFSPSFVFLVLLYFQTYERHGL